MTVTTTTATLKMEFQHLDVSFEEILMTMVTEVIAAIIIIIIVIVTATVMMDGITV